MRGDGDLKSNILIDLNNDPLFALGDSVATKDPREPMTDLFSLVVVGNDSSYARDIS